MLFILDFLRLFYLPFRQPQRKHEEKMKSVILYGRQYGSQRPRKKFCIKITPNGSVPLSVSFLYSNHAQKFFPFTSAFLCATDQNPKRQINRRLCSIGYCLIFIALTFRETCAILATMKRQQARRFLLVQLRSDALRQRWRRLNTENVFKRFFIFVSFAKRYFLFFH